MGFDKTRPPALKGHNYTFDSFENGKVVENKKKNRLPAMGWNSWNAFGSNNTEALTKAMADCIVDLELDRCGYEYVVLDDGCYLPKRVDGKLANEPVKFPSGFKALSDYIHSKELKFGMYNDIGTNLCAGAEVGTCFHEMEDAASYVEWGVDFLKVDNCYYLWDNATFSDPKGIKYVFTPIIKNVRIKDDDTVIFEQTYDFSKGFGTNDGTGPVQTPVGPQSDELTIEVNGGFGGMFSLEVQYELPSSPKDDASDLKDGVGTWIQIATGEGEDSSLVFDDFVPENEDTLRIPLMLNEGRNVVRIMNHRRQENTLASYARLLEGLNAASPNHNIYYSICEWGKTQPQNWGWKVGDSWRILNDITFAVGNDGDPGKADWSSDYTPGVCVQYNKAVIMDEFSGLEKGWNDPDMLMIGMNGLNLTQNKTHMTMWCLLNAPLMLGLDLRRLKKGDELWTIISNMDVISLNQDTLGIQAKRVKVIKADESVVDAPDKEYIRDNDRVDILAKPLSDGSIALSFINLSDKESGEISYDLADLDLNGLNFKDIEKYEIKDLWTKEIREQKDSVIMAGPLKPFDNVTLKISF